MCKDSNDTVAREPYLSTLVIDTELRWLDSAPQQPTESSRKPGAVSWERAGRLVARLDLG